MGEKVRFKDLTAYVFEYSRAFWIT